MRRWILFVLVAMATLLAVGAIFYSSWPSEPVAEVELVAPMPVGVEFATLAGDPFPLERLRGRVILLHFWASWCPPCVKELPSLASLTERMGGRLALVAVSNDASAGEARRFLERLPGLREGGGNVFLLHDPGGRITRESFAVYRFPESFVVSKEYGIVRKLVGEVDWSRPELLRFLEGL